MRTGVLLLLVMALFFGCTDESANNTEIKLAYTTDGLEATITGSVLNNSFTVTNLEINWGDASALTSIKNGFDSIDETHKYIDEGVYNIVASSTNSVGDTTIEQLTVTVTFRETSFAGIRETLYKTTADEYLFLTLNLHTYQEKDQLEKLNMIIDVIGKLDIDFIAFQECAQHKSAALINETIKEDNMAYLITTGLQDKYSMPYEYVWDWSHYGWNVWEEGVAVLSKYPIVSEDARYVSRVTSVGTIESRKVIYAGCQLPDGKQINVFSAHLHWRKSEIDQEQNIQIRSLQGMVDEKSWASSYSFVAGDFNVNPTSNAPWSEGYYNMINNSTYVDSYLVANDGANTKPAQSQHHTVLGSFPGRIDYIFMKSNPDFSVIDSQIIFRPDVVGEVSDHYGVITKMKLVN